VFTEVMGGPNLLAYAAFLVVVKESDKYHLWFNNPVDLETVCRDRWFVYAKYIRAAAMIALDPVKVHRRKVNFCTFDFVSFILL
jgi:hypothetical protein